MMNIHVRRPLPLLLILLISAWWFSFPQSAPADDNSPLIGISMSVDAEGRNHRVGVSYAEAVRRAGGIPVYIPVSSDEDSIRGTLARLDGLIMTGGGDVPPEAYGETPHPTVVTMPQPRFDSDRLLLRLWLEMKKPLLGICLGLQETNVVQGGTLIQDIPSRPGQELLHRENNGPVRHRIRIVEDSLLGRLAAETTPEVYSWHHQAVCKIGRRLQPIARSDDGIIEAMELTDRPFGLLVQFHPERLPDTQMSKSIFRAFISAALAGHKKEKSAVEAIR